MSLALSRQFELDLLTEIKVILEERIKWRRQSSVGNCIDPDGIPTERIIREVDGLLRGKY